MRSEKADQPIEQVHGQPAIAREQPGLTEYQHIQRQLVRVVPRYQLVHLACRGVGCINCFEQAWRRYISAKTG